MAKVVPQSKSTFNIDIWHLVFQELAREDMMANPKRIRRAAYNKFRDNGYYDGYQTAPEGWKMQRAYLERSPNYMLEINCYSEEFMSLVRGVRCLSRDLNQATLSIVYHLFDASGKDSMVVFESFSETTKSRIEMNILNHTKVFKLPEDSTSRIMRLLRESSQLTYLFCELEGDEGRLRAKTLSKPALRQISSEYLGAVMESKPDVTFTKGNGVYLISGYGVYGGTSESRNTSDNATGELAPVESAPKCVDSLVIKVAATLSAGHSMIFKPSKSRLPPVQAFKSNAGWFYDAEEVAAIWDFSQIRQLELKRSMEHFWTSVPCGDFKNLEILEFDPIINNVADQEPILRLMSEFVEGIRALDALSIIRPCQYAGICPMKSIIQAGGESLRYLKLDYYYRQGTDDVSLSDIRRLQAACPNIEYLEFVHPFFPHANIRRYPDRVRFDADETLEILPRFRKLEDLHLLFDNDLGTPFDRRNQAYSYSTDPDYDDAKRIMQKLHDNKLGVPFDNMSIELRASTKPRNWRPKPGATIDSGGWRWNQTRVFHSRRDGSYQQWGSERVGELEEDDEDWI